MSSVDVFDLSVSFSIGLIGVVLVPFYLDLRRSRCIAIIFCVPSGFDNDRRESGSKL